MDENNVKISLHNFKKIDCYQTKILSVIHANECFRIGVDLKNNDIDTVIIKSSGSLRVAFDKPENVKVVPLASHMPFDVKILPGISKPAITSNGYKIFSSDKSINVLVTATVTTTMGDIKVSRYFVIDIMV